jgi:hypothetical protein
MAKPTTELSAQDRVILFCTATGIDHAAVGILAHAMQSMAIRGFIAYNRESGSYTLTDSGRATLGAILDGPLNIVNIPPTAPDQPVFRARR